MKEGLVIRSTGSWYLVKTDDGLEIECKVRGKFRLQGIRSTSPVVVGDRVSITLSDENTALITKIEERKNYVLRRSSNLSKESHILAANIDLCFLVVTITQPTTYTTFIDRFLATCQAYIVPVHLIFNKIDLYDDEDTTYLNALVHLYEHIGYACSKISVWNNQGIEELRAHIKDKTILFSGHSGVGKSTLINALVPNMHLRTAKVSDYHGKGMHTTTYSEMIKLPDGGYLIDTPGVKGFGMVNMKKEEISHYFKEIFKFSAQCRFNNCIHINEPGCAVLEAVEKHYISESRYKSYINMMEAEEDEKYR